MNKVAIKKIGFEKLNDVNDQWVQQEEHQERSLNQDVYIDGIQRFRSIDQQYASMTEELTMDESGNKYHQQLQFTVRTEYDRNLAKKYERRPLVVHVWTVDGNYYKLGTKEYPAYFIPAKTNSKETVETSITVEYDTLTAIM